MTHEPSILPEGSREDHDVPCSNCGEAAPDAYCPSCGQNQGHSHVSILYWIREALDEVLSLNGKLPRTLGALFFRPGRLTRAWIEGRQVAYVRPLRLFLGILVVFFALLFAFDLDSPSSSEDAEGTPGEPAVEEVATTPPVTATDLLQGSYGETPEQLAARQTTRGVVTVLLFLLVPFVAVCLKALFLGSGRYLIEHLVFALHWASFFAFALLLGLASDTLSSRLLGADSVAEPVLGFAVLGWLVVYTVLALSRTYGASWAGSLTRTVAIGLLFFVVGELGAYPIGYVVGRVGAALSLDPLAAQEERAYDLLRQARSAREQGDSARLHLLLPVTIKAFYRIADDQEDRHNRYHLAEAQLWAGQSFAALATAEEMITGAPEDPLALGMAGRAACLTGRDSLGAERYRAYLAKYVRRGRDSLVENHGHDGDLEAYGRDAANQPNPCESMRQRTR